VNAINDELEERFGTAAPQFEHHFKWLHEDARDRIIGLPVDG
jgi:hypothetical protein